MNPSHTLTLPGLDGANPLGFLAALGTWRITDQIYPETKMYWKSHGGHWVPALSTRHAMDSKTFIEKLHAELAKMRHHRVFTFSRNLKLKPNEFEREATAALKSWFEEDDQTSVAFFTAFGSSATINEQGDIEDTAFRTMSGAGHQHFLKTMNDLAEVTTKDQLRNTLLETWTYPDEKIGLRWDPSEDKRYALAWRNPSQDPTRTQRGANRLAIEALPLLPTAPMGSHLETTGFTGHRSNDTYWTWPIWTSPISLDTGRSLLALGEIKNGSPSATDLRPRGVTAVFRSQRITTGKFRNFTPAIQIA